MVGTHPHSVVGFPFSSRLAGNTFMLWLLRQGWKGMYVYRYTCKEYYIMPHVFGDYWYVRVHSEAPLAER